jgi:ubiquinone/menaquinone biosynthesis C-methylase UbiE
LLAATLEETPPAIREQETTVDELPSLTEDSKFDCDDSVAFWKDFEVTAEEAPGYMANIITPHLTAGSPQARAYWLYHAARSGYFSTNAVVGTLSHVLHERVIKRSDKVAGIFGDVGAVSKLLKLLTEAFVSYEQNWKWVEQGVLNYPWDAALQSNKKGDVILQLDHKQSNPLFALQETTRLIRESIGVWGRRVRLEGTPAGVWLDDSSQQTDAQQYPSYFLNDFHYQTDGWMSSESANRYEVSTETLFLGRQDSMQRQTLVPLKKYFADESPKTILEVACGTGRYATFARDNFPTSNMTLVDLSPFYLEKARENEKYWRSYRGEQAMKIATGRETEAPDTTRFAQANAEKLPFPDNSFDAVTSIYLFHELPHEARVNAAAEMTRVCKPGGMVVFSDSLQKGDRPLLYAETSRADFSQLNEPHYASYLQEDLAALFEKPGLKCDEKYMNSRTKRPCPF